MCYELGLEASRDIELDKDKKGGLARFFTFDHKTLYGYKYF